MLAAAVDARVPGIGVDRLEPDAEFPDLCPVAGLGALADAADAAHVVFVEVPAVVPYLKPILEQLERDLGRAGVLGILEQLEDDIANARCGHRHVPFISRRDEWRRR
jgi:hypothetical protein